MIVDGEKRKYLRANLRWTVYLFREGDTHPVESKTRNLSSGGFYCFFDEPIEVRASLRCRIIIPAKSIDSPGNLLGLDCRAIVLRVERTASGGAYGVACAIQDYSVVHLDRKPAKHAIAGT